MNSAKSYIFGKDMKAINSHVPAMNTQKMKYTIYLIYKRDINIKHVGIKVTWYKFQLQKIELQNGSGKES